MPRIETIKPLTASDIRKKRTKLLSETDWTDLVSAQTRLEANELQQAESYRQALRDVTAQQAFIDGDYNGVVYPPKPNFIS